MKVSDRIALVRMVLQKALLQAVSGISTDLAARLALKIWFQRLPRFVTPPAIDWSTLDAPLSWVYSEGRAVAVRAFGNGPPVLLVHGLHGCMEDMAPLAMKLAAAGYRAVLMDAPGHGRSGKAEIDGVVVGNALKCVAEERGPLRAIVSHSGASIWVMYAVSSGVTAERLVLIAPIASSNIVLIGFRMFWGIGEKVADALKGKLISRYGEEIWNRFSPVAVAPRTKVSALVVHDKRDSVVPHSEGRTLSEAFPVGSLHTTAGLGHWRVLSDPDTHNRISAFCVAEH